MNNLPARCPFCGGEIVVTRLLCQECDTAIEGRFHSGPFNQLTAEQLQFMVTFVRCEGKLTRMAEEIGLSYPTLRSRLNELIRALGFEPGIEEGSSIVESERQKILEDLDAGRITAEQAMRLLRESEGER